MTAGRGEVVRLDGAAAALGGRTIWRDVSLTVGRGDFVAVLGPNGAGKSTLLRAILGLVPLVAGTASAVGAPPGTGNDRIGYLPQRREFDAGTRIRAMDLVRLGVDGGRWGVPIPSWLPGGGASRAASRRVTETLELVDAAPYARRPIGELSGGEQQRILIAQALVRAPEVLMLDEPLDNLDLPGQRSVAALLQRICSSRDVAVLLVTHDVNPILPYLDRIVYFAGGTAVAGKPDEVITSDALSRLYGSPIEVLRASDGRLVVVGQPEAPHVHTPRHA